MSTTIVYAIPNCNTVKKALDWMKANKQAYSFHDYKKQGITSAQLTSWAKQVGWEALINKKGTTWRGLPEATKEGVTNATSATKLMIENTSVIKRPVLCKGKTVLVGFDADTFEEHLL